MSVRIRMKQMGRTHRHYYRICATDTKNPRDGRIIEEVGTYDPSIPETDARVTFNQERLQYWLSVGALPSEHVAIFIKKYGPNGSHLEAQKNAVSKVKGPKTVAPVGEPKFIRKSKEELAAEAAAVAAAAEAAANEAPAEATAEAPAPEAAG
jgi:small subunit ribosomal protein S16